MTSREIIESLKGIRDHAPHAHPETTAEVINSLIEMIEAGEGPRKPWCCFPTCRANAEWSIHANAGGPETHACSDHVGHLLTDAPEHCVCRIG
jgi:hypothetical protein